MVDSHTHLSDQLFDKDRDDIIKECLLHKITTFLEILCSANEWNRFRYFDKYKKNFYFSFGIHPHYLNELNDVNIKDLRSYLNYEDAIAIGECGIDLFYHPQTLNSQLELLELHIDLAEEFKKVIIFHIRSSKLMNAYKIFFEFIKTRKLKYGGVIHSFSGDIEDAKMAIENGFSLGINATITYPKNEKLRDVVKYAGIKHILTETDSPYLPPQLIRGKRNTPLSIKEIINTISTLTKMEIEAIDEEITTNFKRIFKLQMEIKEYKD